jgi:hypothetical protein
MARSIAGQQQAQNQMRVILGDQITASIDSQGHQAPGQQHSYKNSMAYNKRQLQFQNSEQVSVKKNNLFDGSQTRNNPKVSSKDSHSKNKQKVN